MQVRKPKPDAFAGRAEAKKKKKKKPQAFGADGMTYLPKGAEAGAGAGTKAGAGQLKTLVYNPPASRVPHVSAPLLDLQPAKGGGNYASFESVVCEGKSRHVFHDVDGGYDWRKELEGLRGEVERKEEVRIG